MNVLFVCSRNQWRSPTAEKTFRKSPGISARSAGTTRAARRQISVADIRWADVVMVMEEKHKARIIADFRAETQNKPIHVLDIADDYQFMDKELVELLQEKVPPMLFDEANQT